MRIPHYVTIVLTAMLIAGVLVFWLITRPFPADSDGDSALRGSKVTYPCAVEDGLPDPSCTPGDVLKVPKATVCQKGYSKAVRNVPEALKQYVYKQYGVLSHPKGEYEVDHLISLELGGSNATSNLWPEPAEPHPGYHEKDLIENWLHRQVCDGVMTLEDAQRGIRNNWKQYLNQEENP